MTYKKHFVLFTITLITLFVSTITAFGAVDIPAPKMHVVDRAKIIDKKTESRLNAFLSELETKTGAQMVVLTVKTTGGAPVDQFSIDLANAWKLGQFEQNNGVLVVVATKDRKGMSPMDVVAVLTKVVKEQQRIITELSKEMAELKKELRSKGTPTLAKLRLND